LFKKQSKFPDNKTNVPFIVNKDEKKKSMKNQKTCIRFSQKFANGLKRKYKAIFEYFFQLKS
jgi:hypothetical protein